MPVRLVVATLLEAQVADAFQCARQTDLVVVATGKRQPTLIVLTSLSVLPQSAGRVAQVYQRDTLAARVLGLLLKLARPLMISQRLLMATQSVQNPADDTV